MPKSLGAELSEALENISTMMIRAKGADQKKLSELTHRISGDLRELVDKQVVKALPEYKRATLALEQANDEAEEALKDINKIAAAIKELSSAIDAVSKLAALAA